MTRPIRAIGRALVGAVAVVLVLAGCTGTSSSTPTWTPDTQGTSSALAPFYGQSIAWHSCASGFRCGTATAPLDWAAPGGTRIHLALTMLPASGHRIGTLFVNPGGPGESGVDFLQQGATQFFDPALRQSYDIVAWDPRGVGHSSAVACYGTHDLDEFLFDDPNLPEGDATLKKDVEQSGIDFGKACAAKTGALLAHVDTISTVRDLDMLRAASGSPKLDYFGFSYGTSIGAQYANLFPTHIGRMALDGAVDPAVTSFDQNLANTKAFGQALKSYLASCLKQSSCPFHGLTVDQSVAGIGRLLLKLRESPIRAQDGREVNSAVMRTAIDAALYDEGSWQYLTQAFSQIVQGDPTVAQELADSYVERGASGYQSNLFEAIYAVNCLDSPVTTDPRTLAAQGRQLDAADPLRVADNTNDLGDPVCGNWPVKPVSTPHPITATGSPAVLVLGNTGDPATPYQWAVSLAKQLPKGVLFTYKGQGHTAYRNDDACINVPVDTYFVKGTVPAPRTCG